MKQILKYMTLVVSGALLLASCGPKMNEVDINPAPAVNGEKLLPKTDESGSSRAYVGMEVSAEGFNLNLVKRVSLGDVDAEITRQDIKVLKFKIPAFELPQQDAPHHVTLNIYGADGSTVIYTRPYYVTIPVTDAVITGYTPASGTVGTEITLAGRNLEQVTRVKFDATTIESADFTAVTATSVKFTVPAGAYAAGDSEVAISAEWGVNTIDVTAKGQFKLQTPKFDALASQPSGVNSKIGDEITLVGVNLDRVDEVKWGTANLSITEQSATEMKVKFPASIDKANPVVQTAALSACYGTPAQTVALAAAWRLDTTPTGSAAPSATAMIAADGGADNKFYLGKVVTVTGENLTFVEAIKLQYNDGADRKIAVAIQTGATDTELKFTVPDGVTFSTATKVKVVALYNTTDEVELGEANVYPFYYYKGLRLGIGSNSKNTYTDYAAQNAFYYPDMNRVVSTKDWLTEKLDPLAVGDVPNPAVTAASTLTKSAITSEAYYAIKPYVFFITNSSSKLSIAGCANSNSQTKTHCVGEAGSFTSLPSYFGTPIVLYRVITGEDAAEIVSGAHESMIYTGTTMPNAGAPALGTAETSSVWVKGSVIAMSYSTYTKGGKPDAADDMAKTGYIVIRDITCANPSTGLANDDRAGYIEFDMYWSKTLNE